jgi:predicted PurR-regulated permease PerM
LNGFVIGPVIAALFIAAWDIFTQARQEQKEQRPARGRR